MSTKQAIEGQQALLERNQIQKAVDHLKSSLLSTIANSEPSDISGRESAYRDVRALDSMMKRLQDVINSGMFAEKYESN